MADKLIGVLKGCWLTVEGVEVLCVLVPFPDGIKDDDVLATFKKVLTKQPVALIFQNPNGVIAVAGPPEWRNKIPEGSITKSQLNPIRIFADK